MIRFFTAVSQVFFGGDLRSHLNSRRSELPDDSSLTPVALKGVISLGFYHFLMFNNKRGGGETKDSLGPPGSREDLRHLVVHELPDRRNGSISSGKANLFIYRLIL